MTAQSWWAGHSGYAAKIMSTLARPTALTRTWMALTVSPLSGPLIGICSFRTSDTTPTVTLVF